MSKITITIETPYKLSDPSFKILLQNIKDFLDDFEQIAFDNDEDFEWSVEGDGDGN